MLVDKVIGRITCWSSRHLSYAARAILINSVLLSLHSCWAQVFLIPKGVMKKIIQVCRAFLWDGRSVLSKASPIAWDKVYMPNKYGGLAVQACMKGNMAAIGKYVWQVSLKADMLWVKWVHCVYIKDKSWCDYSPPVDGSWCWKCICSVKDMMKDGFMQRRWGDRGKILYS